MLSHAILSNTSAFLDKTLTSACYSNKYVPLYEELDTEAKKSILTTLDFWGEVCNRSRDKAKYKLYMIKHESSK